MHLSCHTVTWHVYCLLWLFQADAVNLLCHGAAVYCTLLDTIKLQVAQLLLRWGTHGAKSIFLDVKVIKLNYLSDGRHGSISDQWDMRFSLSWPWNNPVRHQGHPMSNLCADSESLISTCHKCFIATMCISRAIKKIQAIFTFMTFKWPLKLIQGHDALSLNGQ